MAQNPLKYSKAHSKQTEFFASDKPIRVLFWGNRVGKCLPLDAPIFMADGSKKQLGDIKEKDKVLAVDLVTLKTVESEVLEISRAGKKTVYRFIFEDGGEVIASEEHEFPVRFGSGKPIIKRRVRAFRDRKVSVSKKTRFISPLEIRTYPQSAPFIDPYLLGFLLGDGCISKQSIRFTCAQPDILERVSTILLKNNFGITKIGKFDYHITDKLWKPTKSHRLKILLSTYNLNVDSHHKFIPKVCFSWNRSNRLLLLSGLIDTDGSLKEYVTVSDLLADDFRRLVSSVGGRSNIKHYQTKNRIYWRLNELLPLSADYKQMISKRQPLYTDRIVRSVEVVGEVECGDITIAHKDHVFISYDSVITGNTEGCAQEVVRYALADKPNVHAPIEIWCACPSYDVQKETTQKKLERYIPKDAIDGNPVYIKSGTWGEIKLKNGTRINFKSYEQGREKFQGAGKRLIWFDEEPPKDIWEECVVRQEAGQPLDIIMSMTPIKGMTWVYDDLFMQTGREDLFISEASWDDNPWLTDRQKELMAANLSDEAVEVRRFGKFVKRVGLVCNWWDREKNLMEYDVTPPYDYYEVLDGGFSDPAAWLLLGVDNDGDLHVVDGFREKGLSDGEIVSRRNQKSTGLRIIKGWVDYPDERLQGNLQKLGMSLERVEKVVGDTQGWDELVAEKLAEYGKMQRGTGKPRLFINRKLDWLIQEIENLTWLEIKRQGASGIEIVPKWDDHRRFGHHFDGLRALGYFVTSFTKKSDDTSKVATTNRQMQSKWSI